MFRTILMPSSSWWSSPRRMYKHSWCCVVRKAKNDINSILCPYQSTGRNILEELNVQRSRSDGLRPLIRSTQQWKETESYWTVFALRSPTVTKYVLQAEKYHLTWRFPVRTDISSALHYKKHSVRVNSHAIKTKCYLLLVFWGVRGDEEIRELTAKSIRK